MIYRVFVEKKENLQAKKIREDLDAQLGIAVEDLREVIRYDVEGITGEELEGAIVNVFSEPPVDTVYRETLPVDEDYKVFAIGTARRSACSFSRRRTARSSSARASSPSRA